MRILPFLFLILAPLAELFAQQRVSRSEPPGAARDTFLVAYEARLARGDSAFRVTEHDPALPDTGYFVRAARASDLARQAFGPVNRPYNVAVIPVDSIGVASDWWVYLFPAQTRHGVWPLGADERFRITSDGRAIRERRRLHQSIVEFYAPPGQMVEAFTHSAVLDVVPEDTDVFAVLARTPRVPQYVITEKYLYRINVDGTIGGRDR